MRFVELEVVMNEQGHTKMLPINADQVCFLTHKVIPTGLKGAGDVDLQKPGTGIDFGGVRPIAVVGTLEEVQKKLEEGNENVRPA